MAIAALKSLRKLLSTVEAPIAFKNFPRELRREKSDRAAIVMCTSFLDVGLKFGILRKMENQSVAITLFDDHGPLHSLNAKIRIAEAMGLFGADTRRNLDIIQTVRNAFAHSLAVESFRTTEVQTACDALQLPSELSPSSPFTGRTRKIAFETAREKFVTTTMLILESVIFSDFLYEDEFGNEHRVNSLA